MHSSCDAHSSTAQIARDTLNCALRKVLRRPEDGLLHNMADLSSLPTDPAALKLMVESLTAQVSRLERKLHDVHALDANVLRRVNTSMAQHVEALSAEADGAHRCQPLCARAVRSAECGSWLCALLAHRALAAHSESRNELPGREAGRVPGEHSRRWSCIRLVGTQSGCARAQRSLLASGRALVDWRHFCAVQHGEDKRETLGGASSSQCCAQGPSGKASAGCGGAHRHHGVAVQATAAASAARACGCEYTGCEHHTARCR